MKRRIFFRTTGQAIAGAALLSHEQLDAAPAPDSPTPTAFGFASAPVLMNPAPDGVSIVCAVNAPATGWVEYGETEALGLRCDTMTEGFLPYEDRALRFRLKGLQPGKTYFYRVHAVAVEFSSSSKARRGAAIATEPRSFRTLNPAAESASFTVWNDTHQTKETLQKLIEAHQAQPGDFLMWNGDITNDIPTEDLLISEYLAPAGLPYAESTPLFFSRGNHDVRGKAARLLSQYAPGAGGSYHYTFRQGPIACVVLDTGEDKPDTSPTYAGLNDFSNYRSEQRQWLKHAIEDPAFKSAPFRIAIMHIPLFWDAEVPTDWPPVWGGFNGWICEDGRNKWHDLLEKAGIRFVISGHTHRHAWFPHQASHSYGQLIGGGPKLDKATIIRIKATQQELRFTVSNLAGEVLISESFTA